MTRTIVNNVTKILDRRGKGRYVMTASRSDYSEWSIKYMVVVVRALNWASTTISLSFASAYKSGKDWALSALCCTAGSPCVCARASQK